MAVVSDKPFPVIAVSMKPDGKTACGSLPTVFTSWLCEVSELEPRRKSDSATLKIVFKIKFEVSVIHRCS